MRREVLYLHDIVEAADAIASFLQGVDYDRFLKDDLVRSAVLQKLMIIGEASAHLSDEFRTCHPEVEWRDIVAFRNFAIHAYFAVNWTIIWQSSSKDAPALRAIVSRILADEYQDNEQL